MQCGNDMVFCTHGAAFQDVLQTAAILVAIVGAFALAGFAVLFVRWIARQQESGGVRQPRTSFRATLAPAATLADRILRSIDRGVTDRDALIRRLGVSSTAFAEALAELTLARPARVEIIGARGGTRQFLLTDAGRAHLYRGTIDIDRRGNVVDFDPARRRRPATTIAFGDAADGTTDYFVRTSSRPRGRE